MSINLYDKTSKNLTALASGSRIWCGTKEEHDATIAAGKMPNNCLIAITNDEVDNCHYSTDERETGMYWIDGKPIYRKVIQINGEVPITTSWGDIPFTKPANMDAIIDFTAIRKDAGTVGLTKLFAINGSAWKWYTPQNAISVNILLVEYTKTTD